MGGSEFEAEMIERDIQEHQRRFLFIANQLVGEVTGECLRPDGIIMLPSGADPRTVEIRASSKT